MDSSRLRNGRRCAVLGDPVAHSLSPALHRAGYEAVGLDWEYEARRVPAGGLAEVVAGLDATWRGLSVTAPLKREARALAGRVTAYAELTGAVNTLVLGDDGSTAGHNTDLPGAMAAVRERSDAPVHRAVLLGGGATAASVGLALCELGASRLTVAVRDPARAGDTLTRLRRHPSAPQVDVVLLDPAAGPDGPEDPAEAPDIVVSTVPAAAQSPALVARYSGAPLLFEVVYDPWPTPLAAGAEGIVVSGLDLLVHQAVLQFELFTGRPVPVEVLRRAGQAALESGGER